MTKEGSAKIVNFMNPGAGVLVLGAREWPYKSYNKKCIIFNLFYQYTAHWLLLYEGIIMLLSYAIVDFYFFYDVAVDMQIRASDKK